MSTLWPHGLQHAGFPSFTISQSCSNSCPLSWLCHPTISSSDVPFSSCLQSFPTSGPFLMSHVFPSGGQSIGASASASVLPMNIHDWFPLGWTGWISLQSKGLSTVFSNTTVQKHKFFGTQPFYGPLSHPYKTTGKTILLTRWTFVSKVMSLLFDILSRLVIAFLPRSKHLLISWLQSPSAVILKPKTIKSVTVSIVSSSICHEVLGPDAMIFIFWMLSFKPAFSLSFSLSSRGSYFLFALYHKGGVICISEAIHISPAILIPACASFSLAFLMMYSAYKLNKQGDNIQPWCTPFPIWNQSVVPCPVLTIASWPAYRFLRRQVRWSGIPVSWRIFHSLFWSTQRLWYSQ